MKTIIFALMFFSTSCSSNVIQSLINNEVSSRPDSNYRFSILQGSTDESSTVIRLVYPNFLKPIYKIRDSKKNRVKIQDIQYFERKAFEFRVSHLIINNLSPNETYTLEVITQDKKWKDKRTFKTLKNNNEPFSVLIASCMSDTYNEIGNKIWPKAYKHNPDLVFLIGDNLYADVYSGIYIGSKIPTSIEHLWRRHVDHAMKMKIYRMDKLIPTYTTWDDHDYGVNDGDKSYIYKEESAKIFRTFFPSYKNNNVVKGKGVGNIFTFRKNSFFFLDGRSFRDNENKKDGFHLGMGQRKWLQSHLGKSQNLNWLISGDQFFGAYHHFESFEGLHPFEFKNFLKELKILDKRYVFMSGDRHLVEVMEIERELLGKRSLEYTVSGAHTKMYPGSLKRTPNKRRVDGFDGEPNYAIMKISPRGKNFSLHFSGYSLEGKKIEREDFL